MRLIGRILDHTAWSLARHETLIGTKPVLVAVSGGLDSTVLACVLKKLHEQKRVPGTVILAHVDHGVHPLSRAGAEHVVEFAGRLGVECVTRSLRGSATDEASLRQARYHALAQMAAQVDAGCLLTAHHRDDNVETVLFRMFRGTGPRGLAGIPEARFLHANEWSGLNSVESNDPGPATTGLLLLRPLLGESRASLETLAATMDLDPFPDPTNADTRYARNELRLTTIPALRYAMGPSFDRMMTRILNEARASRDLIDAQASRLLTRGLQRVTPWRFEFSVSDDTRTQHPHGVRVAEPSAGPFLEEAFRGMLRQLAPATQEPSRAHLQRLVTMAMDPTPRRLAGRGSELLVERTRNGLLLVDRSRVPAAPSPMAFDIDAGRVRFGATEWTITAASHPQPPLAPSPNESGPMRALLDPRFARGQWYMRAPRADDCFQPLGRTQPTNLRRFLAKRHIPHFDRDRLPVLVDSDDRILWVPGVEIAHHARLRLDTRRAIELNAALGS